MNKRVIKEAAERYREYILPPYDTMMDLSGFDAICEFSGHFGGMSAYIPSMRTIFAQCIEQDILRLRKKGANLQEMVRQYGYSERYIQKMLKRAL